jgi:hypothetical protein
MKIQDGRGRDRSVGRSRQPGNVRVSAGGCHETGDRITKCKIQYWDRNHNQWREAFGVVPMGAIQRDHFPSATGSKLRLLVQETKGGQTPSSFALAADDHEAPAERQP